MDKSGATWQEMALVYDMNAYARSLRFFPAFLALTGLAAASCEDDPIIRVPPPEIHTDQLKQQPAALVDILWVVDNSGTMVDEQEAPSCLCMDGSISVLQTADEGTLAAARGIRGCVEGG